MLGMRKEEGRLEAVLTRRSGMARVELMEKGRKARMLALARGYSRRKYGKGRSTVLTLAENAEEGVRMIRAAELGAVKEAAGFDVCGLWLPTYDHTAPGCDKEFYRDAAILCAERDWCLMLGEEKRALGQGGTLFGYQQLGVLPDAGIFRGGVLVGDKLAGEETRKRGEGTLSRERCLELLGELAENFP